MSTSDVIIFLTTVLVCTVSNQKIEPKEGTQIFLTKDFNVKPSPIIPIEFFTTENLNAFVEPIPGTEIQATKPIPIQETKLPPINVDSPCEMKIEPALASFTIDATPKLAPIILASEAQTTWEQFGAIAPTQVVSSAASGPFTMPSNSLTPPKE